MVSTSPTDLKALYNRYEGGYPDANETRRKILEAINYIVDNFADMRNTYLMKPYALQSLLIALIHCRDGIDAIEQDMSIAPIGAFSADSGRAASVLMEIARAHEVKEVDGPYGKYVWGASGGTNRSGRRKARLIAILRALGANVPANADANLA